MRVAKASACYLHSTIYRYWNPFYHSTTHTFRLSHMLVKRYLMALFRYGWQVAASLIVYRR